LLGSDHPCILRAGSGVLGAAPPPPCVARGDFHLVDEDAVLVASWMVHGMEAMALC
jgi:hypothetical protein